MGKSKFLVEAPQAFAARSWCHCVERGTPHNEAAYIIGAPIEEAYKGQ
ncbi:MAG: hypothetical protein ACJAZO_000946 [Myxococcota bacterium]|jgi:hypothetical protein